MATRVRSVLVLACVAATTTAPSARATTIAVHRWLLDGNTDDTGVGPNGDGTGLVPLTLGGNAAFIDSDEGGGVVLSGVVGDANNRDYLNGEDVGFAATYGVTITAFVRLAVNKWDQAYRRIVFLEASGGNRMELQTMHSGRVSLRIKNEGTLKNLSTGASRPFFTWVDEGKWVHVAGTVTSEGVMMLYRDGETLASTSCTGAYGCLNCNGWTCNAGIKPNPDRKNYMLEVGREPGVDSKYFDGAIRDLRFYERALSAYEVNAVFSGMTLTASPSASPSVLVTARPTTLGEGADSALDRLLDDWDNDDASKLAMASAMAARIDRDAETGACTWT